MSDKSDVFIDIETIPQQPEIGAKKLIAETIRAPAQMTKPETIAEWHEGKGKYEGVKDAAIEEAYLRTSFDGAKGEICSISYAVGKDEVKSFTRNGPSETEADILIEFSDSLYADLPPQLDPYFIGHFVGGFDLKFLYQRFVVNRTRPAFKIKHTGRHGVDFFDNQIAWAGYKGTISQHSLCIALGIPGKPDSMDGSVVWPMWQAKDYKGICDYNRDDVAKCRAIYRRLTFT